MKNQTTIKCPAKINLTLDVVNRRPDGYHNLSMIMQTIGIYDTLEITLTDKDFALETNIPDLETDNNNLIIKAAKMFRDQTKINFGADFRLTKEIPMGAGLGGGSTDAAGTLKGLNLLFDNPLSHEQLSVMAKNLGADVPFFLTGGCMQAEGIGEILTPLTPLKNCYVLVAKPPVHVSTAFVYKNLVLDETTHHPDTKVVATALNTENLELLGQNAGNVLETVTVTAHPEIEEYKTRMKNHGAVYSLMSGSGSSVFGIFRTQSDALAAAQEFVSLTPEVFCTTAV